MSKRKLLPRLNDTSQLQILFPRKDICRCFPLDVECYQWIENIWFVKSDKQDEVGTFNIRIKC